MQRILGSAAGAAEIKQSGISGYSGYSWKVMKGNYKIKRGLIVVSLSMRCNERWGICEISVETLQFKRVKWPLISKMFITLLGRKFKVRHINPTTRYTSVKSRLNLTDKLVY